MENHISSKIFEDPQESGHFFLLPININELGVCMFVFNVYVYVCNLITISTSIQVDHWSNRRPSKAFECHIDVTLIFGWVTFCSAVAFTVKPTYWSHLVEALKIGICMEYMYELQFFN